MSRFLTTSARAAALTAVAGAVSLSAAGAASATTTSTVVKDNAVTVTFTLEAGQFADACVAAITPTSYGPTLISMLKSGGVGAVPQILADGKVLILKAGTLPVATPNVLAPSVTVATSGATATYALVTFCASKTEPGMSTITVGDPVEATLGSLQSFSADGNPATLLALLGDLSTSGR